MKVLVTGATGFLGRFVVDTLKKRGYQVTAVGSKDCDLTKETSLNQFNGIKFDQIYHLAVSIQAGDYPMRHQGELWIVNQKINTNMLSWWYEQQRQAKMITMGTSCAYEDGAVLKEENFLLGLPHDSLFAYAMTKRMLYSGLVSLNKQFGMKYLCLIPSTLYGPGYHNDERQLHFIFDLMRKIINAKNGGEPAVLWGDGNQKRELVLIEDFIKVMMHLVDTQENMLVNIGAGQEHTIRHFADVICKYVGYDPHLVQYDTSKYVGSKSKCLVIEKLETLMPDLEYSTLEKGIEMTVEWYQKTHSKSQLNLSSRKN